MSEDWAASDAYIATLEDASGIADALMRRYRPREQPCPTCNGDGHACTFDGVDLGPCSSCDGTGASADDAITEAGE
jgi:hypothetical protein